MLGIKAAQQESEWKIYKDDRIRSQKKKRNCLTEIC